MHSFELVFQTRPSERNVWSYLYKYTHPRNGKTHNSVLIICRISYTILSPLTRQETTKNIDTRWGTDQAFKRVFFVWNVYSCQKARTYEKEAVTSKPMLVKSWMYCFTPLPGFLSWHCKAVYACFYIDSKSPMNWFAQVDSWHGGKLVLKEFFYCSRWRIHTQKVCVRGCVCAGRSELFWTGSYAFKAPVMCVYERNEVKRSK